MSESSFQGFLYELGGGIAQLYATDGPIYKALERELAEIQRRDDAYLGSLGDHARSVELTRRRIARCEARFRAALDFSPCGCDEW